MFSTTRNNVPAIVPNVNVSESIKDLRKILCERAKVEHDKRMFKAVEESKNMYEEELREIEERLQKMRLLKELGYNISITASSNCRSSKSPVIEDLVCRPRTSVGERMQIGGHSRTCLDWICDKKSGECSNKKCPGECSNCSYSNKKCSNWKCTFLHGAEFANGIDGKLIASSNGNPVLVPVGSLKFQCVINGEIFDIVQMPHAKFAMLILGSGMYAFMCTKPNPNGSGTVPWLYNVRDPRIQLGSAFFITRCDALSSLGFPKWQPFRMFRFDEVEKAEAFELNAQYQA
jgi:hypothetical protein